MEERIKKLIEYYGLSIYAFEQKISASEGQIYKGLSRKKGFQSATIVKILEVFPDISPDWLLLGKGEMLRQNSVKNDDEGVPMVKIPADVWEAMQLQTASLKEKDAQITRLIEMLGSNDKQMNNVNINS